jgi:hypothetical protein
MKQPRGGGRRCRAWQGCRLNRAGLCVFRLLILCTWLRLHRPNTLKTERTAFGSAGTIERRPSAAGWRSMGINTIIMVDDEKADDHTQERIGSTSDAKYDIATQKRTDETPRSPPNPPPTSFPVLQASSAL